MKKQYLTTLLCCLLCLCALPAAAQEADLPAVYIAYEPNTVLTTDNAVPAQVTLVSPEGETTFSADLRLVKPVSDAAEDSLPQKSLRIDGEEYRFILHNDGGDAIGTKLMSAVCCRLIGQGPVASPVRTQEPVIVYLNGEYWGLYNKREMIEDAIAHFENLPDTAQLSVARFNGQPVWGDASGVAALYGKSQTLDLSLAEARQTLNGLLDTDSFLNWMAVNTYLGNANLHGELYLYRVGDGPWKFATGDFAYAFYSASDNSIARLVKQENTRFSWGKAAELADRMLQQPEYQGAFLAKLGALYQAWPADVMQAAVDVEKERIGDAMPAHMERWADEYVQVMGKEYVYPAANGEEALLFWQYRVYRLRDKTLVRRPWYVYDSVQNALGVSDADMVRFFGSTKPELPQVPEDSWMDFQSAAP